MNHKKSNSKETFNNIIQILKDIHKLQPDMDVCRHIADSTAEYPNLWGVSNKEFLYQLEKYKLELENNIVTKDDISKVYTEGLDLENILSEDPFEEDQEF